MNYLKRLLSFFIALCVAVPLFVNLSAVGEEIQPDAGTGNITYQSCITENAVWALSENFSAENSDGAKAVVCEDGTAAYLLEKGSTAAFRFSVAKAGKYIVAVKFGNVSQTAESYDFALEIDNESPFSGSDELELNAIWEDDGNIRTLANGDEVNPAQKHKEGFILQTVTDKSGVELMPYTVELAAGEHIVSLTSTNMPFLLAGVAFDIPLDIPLYSEVSGSYGGYSKYEGDQIVIEAEKSLYRSAYSLSPKSDNSSASISPSSASDSLINYIGGTTWSEPGDEIAWQFEAPEDGLYKIGFSFKQNTVSNGEVYRWLKIDGKTPFAEAAEIGFRYATKWQFESFADEQGNDYLIYLTKGTHILSLEVTLSDVAQVFSLLEEIVEPLGKLYLEMVMITGDTPDRNRDYELHKQIPDFVSILETVSENIKSLEAKIGTQLNVNTELKGALNNMDRIVSEMTENLYSAHLQISSYYTAYQTLSAWLYDIKAMGLSLDQIILAAPDSEYDEPTAGIIDRFIFWLKRYANSYSQNTAVISGGDETQPTIKIWVNWGRDQVKVLNTLIQDSFTSEKNINVKVEQVNATLVQGVISGNSPDLYLNMARTEPVNLAMRGVLYNLKNFEDFDQVLSGFQDGAEIPYIYRDGCYALPDTQSFYVMFCRTDILGELGIEIPKTWDEFLNATGILQRNNMSSYLPYVKITAATTVNTGAGGLSIFPTMLLQQGGSVYNESRDATVLDSADSVNAFTFWTDFYTKYSLDPDANFYQKFRVGIIPLGIAAYNQYLTFRVSAPEIDGKWVIAEIPGTINGDGTVNNVCSGSGTGCAIMNSSKEKMAAWEFLKWWVSADTQYRYSAEIEAILGESGRIASATKDAISRLSWDSDSLDVIMSQWSKVSEIPEVPGSYYVSRSIDQAFWEVNNNDSSPKEAIKDWNEISNKEVARKIAEYADMDLGD